ncbi:MAG: glycosyltransferase [Ignavibacteria bacterium]|nr:glycosyltransferase [Ignavibacteria bacterium]
MLTIFSIVIVYITLVNFVILLSFFYKRKNVSIAKSQELLEKASVIVAFRNEKENLPDLIEALKSQSITSDNFEVILIDDYSTDNSYQIAKNLTQDLKHFSVLSNKYSQGKKNALRTGIENSKFDILVFTDADCIPNKNWLETILKNFDSNTDIVYGYSPFLQQKNFTNLICRYENLFTSILITSFDNIGYPYMSFGRNFAYRKSLFFRLGEFKLIEKSLSGDDDLFFQLALRNGAKAKLIFDYNSLVFTKCPKTFNEFLRRKSRHVSASKFYFSGIKITLAVIYGSNIILSFLLIPSIFYLDLFLLTFIFLNWFLKIVMIKTLTEQLRIKFSFLKIPFVDFIYNFLLIIIGIRSRFNVSWK